jgi:hypothetical protein
MSKVYLLLSGENSPGDQIYIESIHSTREGAMLAKAEYEAIEHKRWDGTVYYEKAYIEEHDLHP